MQALGLTIVCHHAICDQEHSLFKSFRPRHLQISLQTCFSLNVEMASEPRFPMPKYLEIYKRNWIVPSLPLPPLIFQ